MTPQLLEALKRMAKARGLTNPEIIIKAAEARKRPKPVLYWANPERDL